MLETILNFALLGEAACIFVKYMLLEYAVCCKMVLFDHSNVRLLLGYV